jgi:aminomethyltransferase
VAQDVSGLDLHAWLTGGGLIVARADAIAGDGFHVWAPVSAGLAETWQAALAAGAVPIGEQALETLRIESGLPRFARELSEAYIPLEVGLWRDVSFSKGCYIGQEIIARMESRQRLAKQMAGLRSDAPFEPGADIAFEGEVVGKVSSAAPRPGGDWIGLGFVKPAAATPGARVSIGAERPAQAEIAAFPIP